MNDEGEYREGKENGRRANELETRKREATVIRRTIEPFLRDDPGWKRWLLERVAGKRGKRGEWFGVRSEREIRWLPLFRRWQNK